MKKVLVLAAFAAAAFSAAAQSWPTKPVRLLVGFSAGGPTDLVARVIAQRLGDQLHQTFVVENRPGANGAIAAKEVLAAAPDGYTLLVGTSGALTVSPSIIKNMGYEPLKDLTPIAMLAGYPYVMAVAPTTPVGNVRDLVAYAKQKPELGSFSSAGTGSVNHLAGEWFNSITKLNLTHVPYKGDAPALADLMTGRLLFGFNTIATSMPQVRAGKLKAIAVTSPTRTELAPDVPTMIEQGYADFVVEPWNGILGPSKMPKELVERINAAVDAALKDPAVRARIAETGQYPIVESAHAMKTRIEQQTSQWRRIAVTAGLKPE